jgi:hypothetical protein
MISDAKPDVWQDWEKFVAAAKKMGEESGKLAQVSGRRYRASGPPAGAYPASRENQSRRPPPGRQKRLYPGESLDVGTRSPKRTVMPFLL